jgi:hypothetical protein
MGRLSGQATRNRPPPGHDRRFGPMTISSFVGKSIEKWAKLIRAANIKAD